MLSKAQKREFAKILKNCSQCDIFSLCDTSTERIVRPVNRLDAEHAIIQYTDSASQLLKRQKLKRECLLHYLKETGVNVPTNATKSDLVDKILTTWNSENGRTLVPQSSACAPSSIRRTGISASSPSTNFRVDFSSARTPSKVEVDFAASSPVSRIKLHFSSQPSEPKGSTNPRHPLAEKFSSWFYPMLNSHNIFTSGAYEEFGVQHFLDDCVLNIGIVGGHENHEFQGAQSVVARCLALVREEGLIFNPSRSTEKRDAHGLVLVTVAGTVHRRHKFMGVFDQCFGLVKNPLTNKMLIKFIELKVKQGVLESDLRKLKYVK